MPIKEREVIRKKLSKGATRKAVAAEHGISLATVTNIAHATTEPKQADHRWVDPRWEKFAKLTGTKAPPKDESNEYLDWELANVTKADVCTIRTVWTDKTVKIAEIAYHLQLHPSTIWTVGGNPWIEGV